MSVLAHQILLLLKIIRLKLASRYLKTNLFSDVSFLIDSAYTLGEVVKMREKKTILFQSETASSKVFRDEAIVNDNLVIVETFYN